MRIQCKDVTKSFTRHNRRAFSLIELMAVVGIIMLMTAVSLPSLASFTKQSGRRNAITQLLNVFEQARVAALETGTKVHIVFANGQAVFGNDSNPTEDARYRAFQVLREDEDGNSLPMTKWIFLPKGIAFKSEIQSLIGQTVNSKQVRYLQQDVVVPAITFNGTGSVEAPTDKKVLKFYIYEGGFRNGQDNFTLGTSQSAEAGLFEVFRVARYTGRTEIDVMNLANARAGN